MGARNQLARDPGSKPDNTTRTPFMRQPDVKHSQNRIMPLAEHPSMSPNWDPTNKEQVNNRTRKQTSSNLYSTTKGYGPRHKIEHKETPTPYRPPGQKGKVGYKRGRG